MVEEAGPQYDVIIIGGGPGGSTTGALLKKYGKDLRVLILEKEVFPREHVGESQLPPISRILEEMGCWDDVERAGFPIKIGVTYTWGRTTDPWDFEFLPLQAIKEDEPRPAKFEGWRQQTAFQVERDRYDEILLDCAKDHGCEVRQGTRVAKVHTDGDRVTGVELEDGEMVTARYYIDASGNAAVLRKAVGVTIEAPTLLRNVAFWDYWDNEEWAKDVGVGATRVHIRSLPYGWLWFIPLGPTRTSIGLVCPADYYKKCGKSPAELYHDAIHEEKWVNALTQNATSEQEVRSTTDWSFICDRTFGENWFLVGETVGFADPILAAGLTLTQSGGRELAYTILELERGRYDRSWLVDRYNDMQIKRVVQHMRFAEYWYSANGVFEDIQENCTEIAKHSGLKLDPQQAFRWLSQGGLDHDVAGQAGVGGLDVAAIKQIMLRFTGDASNKKHVDWTVNGKNVFKLNLQNANKTKIGQLVNGEIQQADAYERGDRKLEVTGVAGLLVAAMEQSSALPDIMGYLQKAFDAQLPREHHPIALQHAVQTLESMANDYWVLCSTKRGDKVLNVHTPVEGLFIHSHDESGPTGRNVPADEAKA